MNGKENSRYIATRSHGHLLNARQGSGKVQNETKGNLETSNLKCKFKTQKTLKQPVEKNGGENVPSRAASKAGWEGPSEDSTGAQAGTLHKK
jgi:hypothetical protein